MFSKQPIFPKAGETPSDRSPTRTTPGFSSSPIGSTPSTTSQSGAAALTAAASDAGAKGDLTTDVADEASSSKLIVGPEVKLKGAEILDCDMLVVEGRVEATMDSRVIRIAEKGSYAGNVGIDIAEIHGTFEGELTARKRLIIHATGKVSGKIRYGSILIEEGGEISGDVKSFAAEKSDSKSPNTNIKPITASAITP
jgi:cytoskeletal protein CcmA (bactofilin family)